jgi:hypothetical protein
LVLREVALCKDDGTFGLLQTEAFLDLESQPVPSFDLFLKQYIGTGENEGRGKSSCVSHTISDEFDHFMRKVVKSAFLENWRIAGIIH